MFHNQVQQVQQKLNTVQQMVAQVRQSEQNNQHKLQQLAQEEAAAVQQLQRAQQICQECVSNLQSITFSQTAYSTGIPAQNYAGTPGGFGTASLFDPSTMDPSTYQGTLQTFGGTAALSGSQYPASQQNYQTSSGTALSSIATMNPDVYMASREQLGRSMPNLQQIGQQAGISPSSENFSQATGMPGTSRGFNQ